MECIEAQEVISSALDRDDVPAPVLEAAKDHCRTCASCSRLVKTLVAIRRAPLPEPPAGLEERIMSAVRAEAAAKAAASERTVVTGQLAARDARDMPDGAAASPITSLEELRARLKDPRGRRAVVTWSAVAATVFVAAGIGAIAGLRTIVAPSPERVAVLESTALSAGDVGDMGTQPGGSPSATAAPEAGALASKAAGANLIEVGGFAYRFVGPDPSVLATSLTEIGRTRSDLGGSFVSDLRVLGTADRARVFISRGTEVLAFDRVTRSYQGRTYLLRTRPVDKYGDPATMPRDIPEPASPDGAPTFEPAADATGGGVFVLTGRDASAGIALAPGTEPSLSSGWTWWTPAQ